VPSGLCMAKNVSLFFLERKNYRSTLVSYEGLEISNYIF